MTPIDHGSPLLMRFLDAAGIERNCGALVQMICKEITGSS
jgi:hypothetical protein